MRTEKAASSLSIPEFLRRHRKRVVEEWLTQVRKTQKGRELDRPALLDSLPAVLRELAERIEIAERGGSLDTPVQSTTEHAHARLDQGYTVAQLIAEYGILRRTLMSLLDATRAADREGERMLHRILDDMIVKTVDTFARANQRASNALDRISTAAVGAGGLDAFLEALLRVLLETVETVDNVAVFLREGDMLRLRAFVGLDEALAKGFSLRIGEGLAGRMAATRRPLAVRNASVDPLVMNPALKHQAMRGVSGVPLLHEGEVVGALHMGSMTVYEFTKEDTRLLQQVAARATSAIVHHQLRAALDEARESFVNVLAHDLKSPLGTIRGLATLGVRHSETAGDRIATQRFRKIDQQVDYMIRLLEDLLDARLLEAGKLSIRREDLDFCALVREAVEEIQATTTTHRIRLRSCANVRVSADRTRLAQVLGNLLGNAIKYSPDGGRVDVSVRREAGSVVTSIRDQGVGIPEANLETIFRRYDRGRAAQIASGHGLGLYIASQLVRAHGGRIWAERAPDKGSIFSFTIPVSRPKGSRATTRRRRSRR